MRPYRHLHRSSIWSFNPRTHEECDAISFLTLITLLVFQSTHSRGVRPKLPLPAAIPDGFQSTHSRGVRHSYQFYSLKDTGFNPRTHEECDCSWVVSSRVFPRFQSTHSRGVRPRCWPCSMIRSRFQSTHSRGVRPEATSPKKHKY